jgi:hypothetical protein
MKRTTKIAIAVVALAGGGYLLWREEQRTQSFALAAGHSYTFTVHGNPTGAPPNAVSAQAVLASLAVPLVVTGVAAASSTGAPVLTLTVTATAATSLTGGQVASAVGVTSGTFSVSVVDLGPAPAPAATVSGVGRMRQRLRAVR